jgi:Serine carboxypeptidase S28
METNFQRTGVKWLTIGGSYPGAMSAWFKNAYPSLVTAAWSSSGVIYPIANFTDFDMDIYQSTSRSGSDCPDVIKGI